MRKRLKQLVILAMSADTEHHVTFGKNKSEKKGETGTGTRKHSRCAKLMMRIVQDVGLFSRIYDGHPELQVSPSGRKRRMH